MQDPGETCRPRGCSSTWPVPQEPSVDVVSVPRGQHRGSLYPGESEGPGHTPRGPAGVTFRCRVLAPLPAVVRKHAGAAGALPPSRPLPTGGHRFLTHAGRADMSGSSAVRRGQEACSWLEREREVSPAPRSLELGQWPHKLGGPGACPAPSCWAYSCPVATGDRDGGHGGERSPRSRGPYGVLEAAVAPRWSG